MGPSGLVEPFLLRDGYTSDCQDPQKYNTIQYPTKAHLRTLAYLHDTLSIQCIKNSGTYGGYKISILPQKVTFW